MRPRNYLRFCAHALSIALLLRLPLFAEVPTTTPATPPAIQQGQAPVKSVSSDDLMVGNFHALGEVNGMGDIYRSADPIREVEKTGGKPLEDPATVAEADKIFTHLYERGIRTIIDLERPSNKSGAAETGESAARLELEKTSAEKAGIAFISHPMQNKGKNSFQDMSDAQTLAWLQGVEADIFKAAQKGGVEFHCAGGRDRTGIVAAYLRLKYSHWTADQAIQEMRNNGHNWTHFSTDNGKTSWHENHLRAIAAQLEQAGPSTAPSY